MANYSQLPREYFLSTIKQQVDFLRQNSFCLDNRSQMASKNLLSKNFCLIMKNYVMFLF